MIADTVLPTLTLVEGRVMAAETGELVDVEDPAVATELFGETLDTYARARVEADALGMQIEDMERAWLAKLREGVDYQLLAERRQEARNTMARIEATLGGLFGERDSKVSIDTGRVLVTWSKPRETWSLAKPASWYGTEVACQDLAKKLRNYWELSLSHEQALRLAVLVRDWLAPTAKVGEPGAPNITVRANGGGR